MCQPEDIRLEAWKPKLEEDPHGQQFYFFILFSLILSIACIRPSIATDHIFCSVLTDLIWSTVSSSGLPSSRKMKSYWRESSGGLQGW